MTKQTESVDIARALAHLDPTAPWVLDGDGYDGLTWLGEGDKPTLEQLAAADTAAKAVIEASAATAQSDRDAAIAKLEKAGLTLDDFALLIKAATGEP